MAKSISCHDAGKDCGWSANAPTEEELMVIIEEHVKAEHKEIELTPENVANIKTLIKISFLSVILLYEFANFRPKI